ncbi:MAG TPA: dienelactone hydrolase family protein [Polyangiaceae bacterium]|nr:dienelactone hydrolase family protein [Polyangiaceae bacterium]
MRTLRVVAFGLAALVGCRSAPAPEPPPKTTAQAPDRVAPAPAPAPAGGETFDFVELVTGGASRGDRLPLVIALHGLGDRPAAFARAFDGFPARARFVLPHDDATYLDGFAWFPPGDRESPDAARRLSDMSGRLVRFAEALAKERPTAGRPIFTGFSQGGALSLVTGVLHGREIGAAFPVGSFMAASLVPSAAPPGNAPIEGFHGLADTLVPFGTTSERYAALRAAGFRATIHSYPGVPHQISGEERADWFSALARACGEASK